MSSPAEASAASPVGARGSDDRLSPFLSDDASPRSPHGAPSRGGRRDLKPFVQRTDTSGLSQAERVRDQIYDRFVAAAAEEGYRRAEGDERTPYHGYYYRMLYAQGENANGGARDYFKDGLLTEGFALVAWPADYGSSGVQTFIVNQDGVVFQKDLGEDTAAAVEAIQSFDPDSSWTAIVPPEDPAA